uniref:Uncharacterized protein n=1 Tax=Chromera velia CCMP2878 TaxID=1169474 RepID=A0A0G4I9H9_9ALVE|mmetsp:Transcript_8540/g.16733  ORF Transcript_8540/g.16733 Transcript_8540/m.16733 type:complete len:407 (-) Transcript_8540:218-1438(-)|eukprot:Cvel_12276.t1-p1 / transcript=Cvel_12276.t1 / gene=Cvel_12276 / organism=Chromera_velia_CCMP2878 / gene_product=hypothetical protein / transcript_product=hypothetical protein / location=Cvel_scaffold796:26191-27408(-) / protein_length=406 / sequence_SO=supercontig / SO=protein_coding / is_pseudo=false
MDQFRHYSFPGMWIPSDVYFGLEKNRDFAPELRKHIEETYGPIHSCFDNVVPEVGVDLFLCKTPPSDRFSTGCWTVITNGLCRLSFMTPVYNRQGKVEDLVEGTSPYVQMPVFWDPSDAPFPADMPENLKEELAKSREERTERFEKLGDSDTEGDDSEESTEDSEGEVWRLCNLVLHEFVLFLPPWWPVKEVLQSQLAGSKLPAPHTWPFEAIRTYVHYCRQGVPVRPTDMLPCWPTPFTPILSVNAPKDSTDPVAALPPPPRTFLDRLCCRNNDKEWLAGFPEQSVCMPTTSAFLCVLDPHDLEGMIRPETHLSTFYRPAISMIELVPLTFEEKKFNTQHNAETTIHTFETAGGVPFILQPKKSKEKEAEEETEKLEWKRNRNSTNAKQKRGKGGDETVISPFRA